MPRNKFKQPPLTASDLRAWIRSCAQAIGEVMQGGTNNLRDVTLTPGDTETTLNDPRITPSTLAVLVPTTASAAAGLAAGIWQEASAGSIALHHDNQPDIDRTFGVVLHG